MLTKITDDFYIDLDDIFSLSTCDNEYFITRKGRENTTSISKELYLAIKAKLDEHQAQSYTPSSTYLANQLQAEIGVGR